jgi:multidrug efflux pump subunit AcrB
MLPSEWDGDHWYNRWYNASLGSTYYQENIKPHVDKWTGGALRLFYEDIYPKSSYRNPEKTKLFISAELPYGNTIKEMNSIITGVEKYLSTINGIDKYIANVYSGQYGKIEITFKNNFENSDFPHLLKSRLVSLSLNRSGVGWSISGVGQAFTNVATVDMPKFLITMKGYNYDELSHQANLLANKLLHHQRIQNVNTNERQNSSDKQSKEYVLTLDAAKMALRNTNQSQVLKLLSILSLPSNAVLQLPVNEQYYPVFFKEKEANYYSNYKLLHDNIQLDSNKVLPLNTVAKIEMQNTMSSIQKEDRQYIRVLSFDYMGMEEYGNKYLSKVLKEMNREMPIGYTAEQQGLSRNQVTTGVKYVSLIAILIIVIFFICSVLFENLKQPFCIISMIPISFIGLFLIFKFGNFHFDQGGYAAFIMLGGLVTNAAIFIVNDFNNFKKCKSNSLYNRILVKSTVTRSRTVLFATFANCCGLIPFLIEGQKEVFWFSLATGTIGGLVFSLFAVFIVLPVILWKVHHKN